MFAMFRMESGQIWIGRCRKVTADFAEMAYLHGSYPGYEEATVAFKGLMRDIKLGLYPPTWKGRLPTEAELLKSAPWYEDGAFTG